MKHLKKKKSKRVDGKIRKAIKKKAKEHRKKMKKEAKKLRMAGRRPKKDVDIPNLWPWKEQMLRQKLQRMKDHDQEEERRKQIHRKQQIRKSRQNMLLKAIQADPSVSNLNDKSSDQSNIKEGTKNKKWYRRELNKLIETADVLIEVLDARDPQSCRCEEIEQRVLSLKSDATNRNKRVILLLNKIDLIPTEVLRKWIQLLRREFPVIAFKSNTQNQKSNLSQNRMRHTNQDASVTSQAVGAEALLQLLKNYSRSLNLKKSITIGFIGYPNVGKSSVINSLKRTRAAGTSSTPGFTTSLQEIRLDANIKLIDCPGVLLNESDDPTNLVLKNAIRVNEVDGFSAVNSILERCPKESLMHAYMLPEYNSTEEFLFHVAKNRGKLKKGGVPDVEQAATLVLQDWNSGRIPFFVSPPEDSNDGEVRMVSQFSESFDINALLEKNHSMAIDSVKSSKTGKRFVELRATAADKDEVMEE